MGWRPMATYRVLGEFSPGIQVQLTSLVSMAPRRFALLLCGATPTCSDFSWRVSHLLMREMIMGRNGPRCMQRLCRRRARHACCYSTPRVTLRLGIPMPSLLSIMLLALRQSGLSLPREDARDHLRMPL